MSALLHKNLDALASRYPELAVRMRAHTPDARYRPVVTPSNLLDLTVTSRDGEIRLSGVPNPLEEAQTYWRRTRLRNPALMVFLGLDLGYRLCAYLSNPNANTEGYLLIERDPDIFYGLLHVLDLEPVLRNQNAHLIVGAAEGELFNAFRTALEKNILFTLTTSAAVQSDSASYRLAPDYYRAALVAFRDAAHYHFAFSGNSPLDTFIGIRQMLLNVETIAREPGIDALFGRFAKRPAVIVATGPSLDKNYHLLRELQDRALILSVDASLKFLLRSGIRPHLVTCLERVPETLPFFADLDPETCKDTVLAAVPVVRPEVYRVYPGPKAIMYRPLVHFRWLRHEKGTLLTGHSSANMAFKIAETLGCDPIILVGQDLAYADSGETHSSAAYWGKTAPTVTARRVKTLRVRGNYSDTVLTNETWKLFLDSYVKDVGSFPGRVVNATEGGAYIEGTEVTTLRDAIDRYVGEAFAPADQLRAQLLKPDPLEAERYLGWLREEHVPATVSCLDRARDTFQELLGRAHRALQADSRGSQLADELRGIYRDWILQTVVDEFFYECGFQMLQSPFIQTRTDYVALPNRYKHVDEIHRARLELLANNLENNLTILEKTRRLYLDPENTLPN
ncbi:MAG: motility associated factor glycosyltransferase family protein [Deltaproteobacteria bacterium]|nr:motility associated factor glycosyltransferase family protein [Deltaproteobacteria bacterium]